MRVIRSTWLLLQVLINIICISSSKATKATKLYLPRDVIYDSPFRHAVQAARSYYPNNASLYQDMMQSVGSYDGKEQEEGAIVFTITMAGDKDSRGRIEDRLVNQDRSFVLTWNDDTKESKSNHRWFMGVLDGHGGLGHDVAEHIRYELVQEVRNAVAKGEFEQTIGDTHVPNQATGETACAQTDIFDHDTACLANVSTSSLAGQTTLTKTTTTATAVITDYFKRLLVSIDANLPPEKATMGGATASLVFNYDSTLYFVNAGDSQSFLVAAICNDTITTATATSSETSDFCNMRVLYKTRLDKPDDPDEYQRLKATGLDVIKESGDDARVWYKTVHGNEYGLAMSRSIGDWPSSALGVIPEPSVHVVHINETIAEITKQLEQERQEQSKQCTISLDGAIEPPLNDATPITSSGSDTNDVWKGRIELFAISATDGLIDFIEPTEMARHLGRALVPTTRRQHPVTAAADLMRESASKWHRAFHGEYRDDMAIALISEPYLVDQFLLGLTLLTNKLMSSR